MSQLKIAVIGAGHLGKIHAKLIQQVEGVELVAIADPSPKSQQEMIDLYDVEVVSDYQKVIDQIDAAIVATPTRFHFEIAADLLQQGKHVLVEKPMTDCVHDAEELIRLADASQCVISVGHVERFNPAIATALKLVGEPKMIQASRMSGFTFRSTDIGVVHDLMIHDIDLVNSIFDSPVRSVSASGVSVISEHEDISQAMLQFENGCVANLTATRCSYQAERSFQIFGTAGYANVDLAESKVSFVHVPNWVRERRYNLIDTTPDQQAMIREQLFSRILPKSEVEVPRTNAILDEQTDWVRAIGTQRQPRVTVQQGAQAVSIADRVIAAIQSNAWNLDRATASTGLGIYSPEGVPYPEIEALAAEGRNAA